MPVSNIGPKFATHPEWPSPKTRYGALIAVSCSGDAVLISGQQPVLVYYAEDPEYFLADQGWEGLPQEPGVYHVTVEYRPATMHLTLEGHQETDHGFAVLESHRIRELLFGDTSPQPADVQWLLEVQG